MLWGVKVEVYYIVVAQNKQGLKLAPQALSTAPTGYPGFT